MRGAEFPEDQELLESFLMEPITLQFIAEACGGRLSAAGGEECVDRISTDSRKVERGSLFVAIEGENFDGHKFLACAFEQGAWAALVEEKKIESGAKRWPLVITQGNTRKALGELARAYRKQFDLNAIAVAGSNGKTSTKELVAAVVRQKLECVWSEASFNNDIGVPLTLLKLERRHRAGIFEAGTNHPGELRPLLEMIAPNIGIITSIGREHLEHFGSIDGVLEEEGALAEILPGNGLLILNNESYGARQLMQRSRARVVTVGQSLESQWRIREAQASGTGMRFQMESQFSEYSGEYRINLWGMHQVINAAYAIVVGKELGLGRAEIQRGLDSSCASKMRLELKRIDSFLVLDDAYNANADSMRAAIETLEQFPCDGRRIAVLGDMAELGATANEAHEEIGRRAAEGGIDWLMAVGQRSEITGSAARRAGLKNVVEIRDVDQAGEALKDVVQAGDIVLVKASRSSRLERVVEFLKNHFGEGEPITARGN
jgi:UDP-N-acetylmuramoyl-tripeptide--D-alanyl-D-alanine ligase